MKCFVPMDEDEILKLWVKNPKLVAPFSRPFYPSACLDLSCKHKSDPTQISELLSGARTERSLIKST